MGKALIIVDVQNDFTEGGSLAVEGGAKCASLISDYIYAAGAQYELIIATQDWHVDPKEHFSDNPDYKNTWPAHCVAGTKGAELHPNLEVPIDDFFKKGMLTAAYSGFEGYSDDHKALRVLLEEEEIDEVDVCGIATDFCVKATCLDARKENLKTNLLIDLTAHVSMDTRESALKEMEMAGVGIRFFDNEN